MEPFRRTLGNGVYGKFGRSNAKAILRGQEKQSAKCWWCDRTALYQAYVERGPRRGACRPHRDALVAWQAGGKN